MENSNIKKSSGKKVFIVLTVVLVVLTFVSKSLYNYRLPVVSAVLPKQGQINHDVNGKAQIQYARTQSIYSPLDGRIKEILVQEGDSVKKGQCIMQIENPESAEVKNIEAEDDGIITYIGVRTGMYVSMMQNIILYEIAEQSDEWLCSFVVSEDDSEFISSESAVEVVLVGNHSSLEGSIVSMKSYEDSTMAGYQIDVMIQSENQALAGERVKIKIKNKANVYDTLIPESALHKGADGYYVYGLKESESILNRGYCARRISVELLEADENYCAIRGIANDELIIVETTKELRSGSDVYYDGLVEE